jgi:hypothetical protein
MQLLPLGMRMHWRSSVARQVSQTGWQPGEVGFTSSIAGAIRKFGANHTAMGLKHLSMVFWDQKLIHGGAVLGALAMFLSKLGPDIDSDRLNRALGTRKIEAWGLVAAGIKDGPRHLYALHAAIADAYDKARETLDDSQSS